MADQIDTQSMRNSSMAHVDPLTSVCSACRAGPFSREGFRQAISTKESEEKGYSYRRSWAEISQSIDEGCTWCTIVKRARDCLTTDKFPWGEDTSEIEFQVKAGFRKACTILINGNAAANYAIYADEGDDAVEEIGTEVKVLPRTSFVDYDKALESIKSCEAHEHCPAIEETYLPTRVIDCSDPLRPRLVQTDRLVRGLYCTLSYVWGGDQKRKTLLSNVNAYINEGIALPLPQTIADAIFVTHKLGQRYLWVDALCIIQDSVEDKIKELGAMADIYRNSYLTISALSSFRAEQGFLPDEAAVEILPFIFADATKGPGRMKMQYNIPRPSYGRGKYETVKLHSPLGERGWCLQESMLAARRLIFQPPYVYYKCRSFTDKDISNQYILARGPHTKSAHPAEDYLIFTTVNNNPVDEETLRKHWETTVLQYSRRKITVASDKFVALASIAEVYQSVLKDDYIAGLWRRNLMYELMWSVWAPMGPDEMHLPRPAGYRSPTWSWASVDGILNNGGLFPPSSAACYEAEILACTASPKTSSLPFGEVKEASLVVQAKLHPLMNDGSKCAFEVHKGERKGNRFVSSTSSWTFIPPPGNCLGDNVTRENAGGIKFDCSEGTESDHLLEFYVLILRAGRAWRNQGDWMQGFLLVPGNKDKTVYRRVAKLDLYYQFKWLDWFDNAPLQTVTIM